MSTDVCVSCTAPIERAAVTGIFCARCHGQEIPQKAGVKAWLNGPSYVGFALVVVPTFFRVTVNGVNYVAIACGIAALLAGAFALQQARRSTEKGKGITVAALILLLGLFRVVSSGVLSS